jgi:DNA-binding response OmpR family regulator
VIVCLPRADAGDEGAVRLPAAHRPAKPGAFLLVDDEPHVLKLLEAILAARKAKCIAVSNGLDAVETVMARKDDISFVILDIQMPGMDGRRVYARIKKIKPELKVLIASGYDEDVAIGGMLLDSGDGFVQKPFHAKQLLDKIDAIISCNTEEQAG